MCGFDCCLDREQVIDLTFLLAEKFSELKEDEYAERKKLLYRLLAARFTLAMVLNIVAVHYALFAFSVTYIGLMFFELFVLSYTYVVGLMAYKLWYLRGHAKYFYVYMSFFKLFEIVVQIITLSLLSSAGRLFSGGFDTFLNIYSIIDIVLDGLEIIMYMCVGFKLDDNQVHSADEEINSNFGCISHF